MDSTALLERIKSMGHRDARSRFQRLMALADEIVRVDPLGLNSLVRLVAAPTAAQHIASAAYSAEHSARDPFDLRSLVGDPRFVLTLSGETTYDLLERQPRQNYMIDLSKTPVIPTPWKRSRLVSALSLIGFGKKLGPWVADANHILTLVLPYGIGLVEGGNHSLASGLIEHEGRVPASEVIDLSGLYPHIAYDGVSFIRKCDRKRIMTPTNPIGGELFEIGRKMIASDVQCDVERAADSDATYLRSRMQDDGICYHVSINGQDTGQQISGSGLSRALQQADIPAGSDVAKSIILDGAPLTRINDAGEVEKVRLTHFFRPPLKHDLDAIRLL